MKELPQIEEGDDSDSDSYISENLSERNLGTITINSLEPENTENATH